MRARNVKPSLFKNELLATSDPLNTWVFQGLWCMADREGRIEDRPRRIHLEVNPGRAYEGTEAALSWLAEQGFILRYSHGSGQYIQVVNFGKHQKPHPRELVSVIPAPGVDPSHNLGSASKNTYIREKHGPGNGEAQPRHDLEGHEGGGARGQSPALSSFPIPPSPSPLPESPSPDAHASARSRSPVDEAEHHVMFERVRKAYPPFAGRQNWIQAESWCRVRIDEGATWNVLVDAVKRYAAYVKAGGVSDTSKVMSPQTFFGAPDDPWKQLWTLPSKIAKPAAAGWRPDPIDDPPLEVAGHA